MQRIGKFATIALLGAALALPVWAVQGHGHGKGHGKADKADRDDRADKDKDKDKDKADREDRADRDRDNDRDDRADRDRRGDRNADRERDNDGDRRNVRGAAKTPPGWSKGKKTGWGDCNVPPGQAKKSGCHNGRRTRRVITPGNSSNPQDRDDNSTTGGRKRTAADWVRAGQERRAAQNPK